ncbi:MAG TPA: hypothetical protein VKU37_00655 [Verrucomicrobiae bacterium]|nr:hypothetical protein [Verrucomicrobiae bacterium]
MKKTIALILAASVLLLAGCKASHSTPDTQTAWDKLTASHQAAPLDLTTNYTTPVSYFDQITQFPAWKTVPRGRHVFDGVPLDIEGMICLWGEDNATQLHIVFPEKRLGIAMNQKFETLYVYHGCFFTSPDGTPVCAVVFRYADGTSITNQMLYGEDVIDWVANTDKPIIGPTGPRSKLAWVGGTFTPNEDQPLRLCLTAIENPQPSVEVETIDLYSCKSHTAPCIMAMTPGRAGLMQ